VVDLGVRFQFNEHWQIGSSVSNLLNDEHYELFGGDILKRYALGTVAYSWK
jgi:outer membrane receptor protein involved in Fe transport